MVEKINNSVDIKISTKIISPFLFFAVSWLFVLVCYSLKWSKLLVPLSLELLFLLLASVFISVVLMKYTRRIYFNFKINIVDMEKKVKKNLIICTLLFAIEAIGCRGFPLLFLLMGSFSYDEFGLPIIHVVWYCLSSIYCSISWFLFSATKNKKFLFYSLYFIFPGILLITRSFLLYNLMYCFIISFSFKKYDFENIVKPLPKFFLIAIIVFLLFGRIGEIRSSTQTDFSDKADSYISQIALPTENFNNTNLPAVLLWAYCYITTPLSNLQNTITIQSKTNFDEESIYALVGHFLPDMIGKRVNHIFSTGKTVRASLVVPYMNQSTVFTDIFIECGWFGIIYSVFFTFMLILALYSTQKYENIYSYLAFVFFCVTIVLNIFSNMYHFMGVIPQFWIAYFISIIDSKRMFNYLFKASWRKK